MTTVALSNKDINVQSRLIEQNTINGEQQTDINTNKGISQKSNDRWYQTERGQKPIRKKMTWKSCKFKS